MNMPSPPLRNGAPYQAQQSASRYICFPHQLRIPPDTLASSAHVSNSASYHCNRERALSLRILAYPQSPLLPQCREPVHHCADISDARQV